MTDYQIVHEAPAGGRERAIAMQASQKVAVDAVRLANELGIGESEAAEAVAEVAQQLYQQVMAAAAGQGSTTKEG